jgi:hypothetical protein
VSHLVHDRAKDAKRPVAVLTGDTLFIGDVGRPDLMVAAGMKAEDLAGMLYDSLQKLLALPDETIVYPGHGAGSSCGKNLSSETHSTVGVQRKVNYALQPMARAEFVRLLTTDQPCAPAYFGYDAGLNRSERPTPARARERAEALELDADAAPRARGRALLTRATPTPSRQHVRGSINVGLSGRRASWIRDAARSGDVAGSSPPQGGGVRHGLGRIGFDRIAGF